MEGHLQVVLGNFPALRDAGGHLALVGADQAFADPLEDIIGRGGVELLRIDRRNGRQREGQVLIRAERFSGLRFGRRRGPPASA